MGVRGEAERDFDDVEEGRFGQCQAALAEVGSGVKGEDVRASPERFGVEEGGVAAAIGVGTNLADDRSRGAVQELHKHSGCRNTLCGIQNVSG